MATIRNEKVDYRVLNTIVQNKFTGTLLIKDFFGKYVETHGLFRKWWFIKHIIIKLFPHYQKKLGFALTFNHTC